MLPEVAGSDLFSACQVLFGRKTLYSSSFLAGLRPDSLKSTFREKAFLTHPDRAAVLEEGHTLLLARAALPRVSVFTVSRLLAASTI